MFADAQLAARLEETEGSAGAAFVSARGADSFSSRIGGTFVMFDGVDSPLTQTFGLGMFQPAHQSTLLEIEDLFRTRAAAVQHEICPLAGVALVQTLAARVVTCPARCRTSSFWI
jgi:hypothetical protein